jgi:hypothetical protein
MSTTSAPDRSPGAGPGVGVIAGTMSARSEGTHVIDKRSQVRDFWCTDLVKPLVELF